MEFDALYQEKINFRLMYFIAAFLGVISVAMLGLLVYHVTVTPVDDEPGLVWFFLGEFLLMGAITILVLQFHQLNIILTYQGIIIKFGRIKKSIPWIDIESYQVITAGNLLNSGGWKFGLGRKGWYAMYTVIGKPRISLKLNTGTIKELLFSTANPQEVVRIIQKQTGKEESKQ